ncbi:MAG: M23 family metallopeptidase [Flavobacteriales bacterium]|nr:M23 family metallopeptidase [Flavobacteriales bacterium]
MNLIRTFFLVFVVILNAQNYPQFNSKPLKIEPALAGNFAELRSNHFHSGIDYRTNGKVGYNVYSIADGFVSRINVSPTGYGKAVYIDHPNGYTSVYAHCLRFSPKIEQRIREEQYKRKKFKVDLYLDKEELKVTEGEQIAISGNTGSSGGPHLHFEIRDTKSEEPINPFFFGYDVADSRKPIINDIYLYPINGRVNNSKSRVKVNNYSNVYKVLGDISFGIKTFDKHNATENVNGIHRIEVYINDSLYFGYTANRFSFDETRYINALVDYQARTKYKSWIYKNYILPGNHLRMYDNVTNCGILSTKPNKTYDIKFIVYDYKGNSSSKTLYLKGISNSEHDLQKEKTIPYNKTNFFSTDNYVVNFQENSFYEDLPLQLEEKSRKLYLHKSDVPVHKRFELKVKTDFLNKDLLEKAKFVRESNAGAYEKEFLTSKIENGYLVANPRDFGIFSVEYDLIKPTIKPISNLNNKLNEIKFFIQDKQSGIDTYDAFIDEKWILAEYDAKNNLFSIDLNRENIPNGNHKLEIIVTDEANNTSKYLKNFTKVN